MSQQRWIKRTANTLVSQGWTYRYGTRHIVLYPKDPQFKPFTISSSPGDRYGQANAIKQIRKSGGII